MANVQNSAAELEGRAITRTRQNTTATGQQDDFNLDRGNTVLRVSNGSPVVFTGFQVNGTFPQDGDRVTIYGGASSTIRVAEATSTEGQASTSGNRILTPSIRGQIINSDGAMTLVYDAGIWMLESVQPGEPIDVPFSAGNFTGNGSMTWTVDAADQGEWRYLQRGKTLYQKFRVQNTDVGGTASNILQAALPNGFTSGTSNRLLNIPVRNAGTFEAGVVFFSSVGVTVIGFVLLSTANWTLTSSDNTDIFAAFEMEIQ